MLKHFRLSAISGYLPVLCSAFVISRLLSVFNQEWGKSHPHLNPTEIGQKRSSGDCHDM